MRVFLHHSPTKSWELTSFIPEDSLSLLQVQFSDTNSFTTAELQVDLFFNPSPTQEQRDNLREPGVVVITDEKLTFMLFYNPTKTEYKIEERRYTLSLCGILEAAQKYTSKDFWWNVLDTATLLKTLNEFLSKFLPSVIVKMYEDSLCPILEDPNKQPLGEVGSLGGTYPYFQGFVQPSSWLIGRSFEEEEYRYIILGIAGIAKSLQYENTAYALCLAAEEEITSGEITNAQYGSLLVFKIVYDEDQFDWELVDKVLISSSGPSLGHTKSPIHLTGDYASIDVVYDPFLGKEFVAVIYVDIMSVDPSAIYGKRINNCLIDGASLSILDSSSFQLTKLSIQGNTNLTCYPASIIFRHRAIYDEENDRMIGTWLIGINGHPVKDNTGGWDDVGWATVWGIWAIRWYGDSETVESIDLQARPAIVGKVLGAGLQAQSPMERLINFEAFTSYDIEEGQCAGLGAPIEVHRVMGLDCSLGAYGVDLIGMSGIRYSVFYYDPRDDSVTVVSGRNTCDKWLNAKDGVQCCTISATPLGPVKTTGTPGSPGRALEFDGSDDYFLAPDGSNTFPNGFTFSFWVKQEWILTRGIFQWADSLTSPHPSLLLQSFGDSGGKDLYRLYVNGSYRIEFLVTRNQWHHIAIRSDPVNSKVEVIVDATNKYTTDVVFSPLTTGGFYLGNGWPNYWMGKIDEFQVYNIPLTDTKISELYNEGLGRCGQSSDTGLVCGFHFDEESGTTCYNYQGNPAYDGTLYNGVVRFENDINICDPGDILRSVGLHFIYTLATGNDLDSYSGLFAELLTLNLDSNERSCSQIPIIELEPEKSLYIDTESQPWTRFGDVFDCATIAAEVTQEWHDANLKAFKRTLFTTYVRSILSYRFIQPIDPMIAQLLYVFQSRSGVEIFAFACRNEVDKVDWEHVDMTGKVASGVAPKIFATSFNDTEFFRPVIYNQDVIEHTRDPRACPGFERTGSWTTWHPTQGYDPESLPHRIGNISIPIVTQVCEFKTLSEIGRFRAEEQETRLYSPNVYTGHRNFLITPLSYWSYIDSTLDYRNATNLDWLKCHWDYTATGLTYKFDYDEEYIMHLILFHRFQLAEDTHTISGNSYWEEDTSKVIPDNTRIIFSQTALRLMGRYWDALFLGPQGGALLTRFWWREGSLFYSDEAYFDRELSVSIENLSPAWFGQAFYRASHFNDWYNAFETRVGLRNLELHCYGQRHYPILVGVMLDSDIMDQLKESKDPELVDYDTRWQVYEVRVDLNKNSQLILVKETLKQEEDDN